MVLIADKQWEVGRQPVRLPRAQGSEELVFGAVEVGTGRLADSQLCGEAVETSSCRLVVSPVERLDAVKTKPHQVTNDLDHGSLVPPEVPPRMGQYGDAARLMHERNRLPDREFLSHGVGGWEHG